MLGRGAHTHTHTLFSLSQVSYSLKKNAISLWEAGLLNTFSIGSGVTATRAVVRDAEHIELGILRPPVEVAGKKVSVYVKANHTLSSGKTDLAVSTSTQVCPSFEFKARFAYQGLKDLATSFAAVWAAPVCQNCTHAAPHAATHQHTHLHTTTAGWLEDRGVDRPAGCAGPEVRPPHGVWLHPGSPVSCKCVTCMPGDRKSKTSWWRRRGLHRHSRIHLYT